MPTDRPISSLARGALAALIALGAAQTVRAAAGDSAPLEPSSESLSGWPAKVEAAIAVAGSQPEAIARFLSTLGPRALPAMFAALVEMPSTPAANGEIALEPPRRAGLVLALERVPLADLRRHLEAVLAKGPSTGERCTAIEVLEASGGSQELDLMIRCATPEVGEAVEASVSSELHVRVLALLTRDASAYPQLERALPQAVPEVRSVLTRALAKTGSSEALALFARLLERSPSLKLLLLCHLGPLADRCTHPVDDHVLATVRRFLIEGDAEVLLEAEIAAGKLEDFDAIPTLIRLLEDPTRGIRRNALWSLERITGLKLKDNPARWEGWYETEKEWWRNTSSKVLDDLRSTDPARVKTALGDIAGQHLQRHMLAKAVVPVLGSADPSVVVLACTTLRYLRSPVAVPALVPCLAHADPTVRHQAWNSLTTITREDHPADPEAWAAYLVAR